MNLGPRPTFGVKQPELKQVQDNSRKEAGGIWKRQSKRDNSEFLSFKIKLSKERLKELLNKDGETIDLGFVAFPNTNKSVDDKRPDFRIYEDKE